MRKRWHPLSGFGEALGGYGWLVLAIVVLVLTFLASYIEPTRHAKKLLEPEAPAVPDEVLDDLRGAGLLRGPSVGATPSKAIPRPDSYLQDRGYVYNFYPVRNWSSRGVNPIEAIVVHVTGPGTCPGMRSWFNNPAASASAHFGVCKDGSVEQYVELADVSWSQGYINHPNLDNPLIASWVEQSVNPNLRSVGIEVLLTPGELLGDFPAMTAAFDDLMLYLLLTLGIPADRVHIIGHYEIDSVNRSVDPVCCIWLDGTAGYAASRLGAPTNGGGEEITLESIYDRIVEIERRLDAAGIQ